MGSEDRDDNPGIDDLAIDPLWTTRLLSTFLSNELTRTGKRKVVLGLSGGIDSAVAAYLAVEALGPEAIVCVLLPYRSSSPDSILDARWGWIFVIKMTLWVLMLGAVAAHSFLVGPRQLELNRQALEQDESWAAQHLRPLQRRSIMLSVGGLVLSLLVLGSGAFLANHLYSFQAA